MTSATATAEAGPSLTVADHARAMADYMREGTARAYALPNRGPIVLGPDGRLDPSILEAYWTYGFYVFTGVVGAQELAELRADVDRVIEGAPVAPDATVDRHGRPALGAGIVKPPYRWAKPLSDPLGGTDKNNGRHPVKMLEARPADDAPEWTVQLLDGNLHLMESCLRLYGHPGLLAVAAAINGEDFVPYNEVTFVKEPGLGPSVAWHQDGTTHWTSPDWDEGAHGFNFMTQLYPSTAANCVWMLPGSHKLGKVDIKRLVAESGSERIAGAVPMLCEPGETMVLNRQCVHGSFANSSPDRRVTLNEGFFPRRRVLNVTTKKLNGDLVTYDEAHIAERSRLIQLGIDARRQRFPDETPFVYKPLAGRENENRWSDDTRARLLANYNLRDMFI